jgi:hypothetical protein
MPIYSVAPKHVDIKHGGYTVHQCVEVFNDISVEMTNATFGGSVSCLYDQVGRGSFYNRCDDRDDDSDNVSIASSVSENDYICEPREVEIIYKNEKKKIAVMKKERLLVQDRKNAGGLRTKLDYRGHPVEIVYSNQKKKIAERKEAQRLVRERMRAAGMDVAIDEEVEEVVKQTNIQKILAPFKKFGRVVKRCFTGKADKV